MNSTHFSTLGELARAVSAEIAQILSAAISDRGHAVLAVSGGRSPILLFKNLAVQSISWQKVSITLVDERWVPLGDERSNETLVRTHLLQSRAAAATLISVVGSGNTPLSAAAALSKTFIVDVKLRQGIDVAVLGMGDDGHTASWFPESRELVHCLATPNAYAAVSAEAGREARVTMTLSLVAASRKILVCANGEAKQAVLAKAHRDGTVNEYPVRAILRLPNEQIGIRLA